MRRCRKAPHEHTHHLTYERFGNENLDDLLGLCNECHAFLHAKSDFDPLNPSEREHPGILRLKMFGRKTPTPSLRWTPTGILIDVRQGETYNDWEGETDFLSVAEIVNGES